MEKFDTESFIAEIEKRPALWDSTLDLHSNQAHRKQCWDEITEMFGGKGLSATETRDLEINLQKKWKSLRGCFTRELKRQDLVITGADPGPRKSEYKYFQQMTFLCKAVTTLPSRGRVMDNSYNMYGEESTSSNERIKRENSISVSEEAFDAGKILEMATTENDEEDDPLSEIAYQSRKRAKSSEEDEDKMFLMSLLSTLRSVPAHKKLWTRIKLMAVLDEAIRE